MNNDFGFIRSIDSFGRIVIPVDVRTRLKLGKNDKVLLCVTDEGLLIKKISDDQKQDKN